MDPEPSAIVYTTGQVSKICKVAPRTVSNWLDTGRLKGYRIPGSQDRRVPREAMVEFLNEHNLPLSFLDCEECCRVLLIGTEKTLSDRLTDDLAGRGNFRFARVDTGFDAGLVTGKHRQSVVIIDHGIGQRGAVNIAVSLRGDPTHAKALVIGLAGDDEVEPERFRQDGFDEVLVKPFDPAALVERIKQVAAKVSPRIRRRLK